MSKLPSGWARVTLNDIATWASGGTPSRTNPNFFNGSIPWLKTGELGPKTIYATEEHISDTAVMESSAKVFPKGAVAMAMYGATIGKTSILGIKAATNQACAVGIPDATTSEFLYYFLTSQEKIFIDAGKGGAQPNISQSIVKSWPIFLPPFAEQTRIVTKLEELLTDLDAGVAELKSAQKKLAQYRQSLLKAAVEGALTAQWREDNPVTESGAQLLERILQERRARWEAKQLAKFAEQGKTPPKEWQKKYPEPVQPDTTDLPPLPEGWVWATISQLATIGTGVTPLKSKYQYYVDGDIPWVTSGALNNEIVTETIENVTPLALKECRLELYPAGALLIAMYGEGKTRGKCSELGITATINQAIAALVFEDSALACKQYLKYFLLKSYDDMRNQASGGVQPNLNLQIIRSISVPIPPSVEQHAITNILSEQLEAAKDQGAAIDRSLKQSTVQRQNILRAAFAGQLVPHDPNDEPASVLLERIRAQRAVQAPVKKARGRRGKEAT